MAFEMDGEFVLPATREEVWAAMNDPAILCRCIQGCQTLERTEENGFTAKVQMKIGPVSATFSGKVYMRDLNPPNSYRIEGQGDGGAAGFAKGGARVTLSEVPDGTRLRYTVNAEIGGRLAQLGGRLINGVAKRQADQFFQNFADQFGPAGSHPAISAAAAAPPLQIPSAEAPAAPSPVAVHLPAVPAAARPSTPWGWLVALALAVLTGFLLGRSDAADWWIVAVMFLALASAGAGFQVGRADRR